MQAIIETEGLTEAAAATRLRELGPNEIRQAPSKSALVIFLSQFKSSVVLLLLAACVTSALLGEAVDAAAIAAIVFINGVVGFFQEYRAERAVLALRAMTAPRARVLRGGKQLVVPAAAVVPGDALLLEAGDVVAADARLVTAHSLSTNEAVLTGESLPVEKRTAPATAGAPLAEQLDTVFMGTAIATGTGVARVLATGMSTELGKIAHLLDSTESSETPLQRRLAGVSRSLIVLCLGIVALTAVMGIWRSRPPLEVLLSAVTLAVAAVPEGLPAIVTLALAIGVQRMAARNVLIRRLPAVETLGCATVVCTDKTGTLTTGVMAVRELWSRDEQRLLDAAAACCDADLDESGEQGVGDPTEVAILAAAAARGIERARIERERPRLAVAPFDSERKRMSIWRSDRQLYVKGAVEVLLARCSGDTHEAQLQSERMASRGLRVLAVAVGGSEREQDLELLGLLGLADPPRAEAIAAVRQARRAGIRTVMITGDHPTTARTIAAELGIVHESASAEEHVHARATPAKKLEIVRDWIARGEVVAMTGDGVNDAPALREAHIGIAMGKGGTEVTREASDVILTDDNFASIVEAIREGRGIFDNIQKTLVYLLAGNAGELGVMFAAAAAGLPLPLLPIHLLWINLVTDGLPALALVMEPPQSTALSRPPRHPRAPLLGRSEWTYIGVTGLLEATTTLGVFVWALQHRDVVEARTLAFSTIVAAEVLRAFAARSRTQTLWQVGVFGNLRLLAVVALSLALQLVILQTPLTQRLFQLGPLSWSDQVLSLIAGLVPVTVLELCKLLREQSVDTMK